MIDWGREFAALCSWYKWAPWVPAGLTFPQWWQFWWTMMDEKRAALESQAMVLGLPPQVAAATPRAATVQEGGDDRITMAKLRLKERTGRTVFDLRELLEEVQRGGR